MSFTPLGDALNQKVSQDGGTMKKQLEGVDVVEKATDIFNEFFKEEQAVHIKPLFLKNRTLTVTCANSAVAQEIRLNQSEIVEKINNAVGKKEVDRIRYLA